MKPGSLIGMWSVLAWFCFPLVPTLLGSTYHQILNQGFNSRGGPDPRDWGWETWVMLMGPLVGYGFLAGATLDLPDDPARRGVRGWISRRSIWVGVGPWMGFLAWTAIYFALLGVSRAYPRSQGWSLPAGWENTWTGWLSIRALVIAGVGSLAYGWLFVAWATLRRARRLDRFRRSMVRGIAMSAAFVGSLFGSFWTITEVWRSYFFDPRIVPILMGLASLSLMTGCGVTVGEVRRRELFQSMLLAWLLGLALAWRWWSRSRSKPPGTS